MRLLAPLLVLFGLVFAAMDAVVGGQTVGAHARLSDTVPAVDSVVEVPPREVELTFDEPVRPVPQGIRILSPDGRDVASGEATRSADGRSLTVPVDPAGARGSFTVSYRVVSTDGHVVAGSWVFSVGERTATAASADERADPWSRGVEVLGRMLASAGAFLALGTVVVAGLDDTAPLGSSLVRRRAVLVAGTVTLSVGGLLVLVGAAGLYAGSLAGASGALLDVVGATSTGWVVLARVAVAVVLLVCSLVPAVLRRMPVVVAVLAVAATAAPALGGHAVSSSVPVLASTLVAVHLVTGACWLGALAVLSLRWAEDRELLGGYSDVAVVAAPLVVVSGLGGAWIQVGGAGDLLGSTYTRLLLAKALLAAVLLVLGWMNRRALARAAGTALDLASSVRLETVLGVAVLAVSAVLVVTPPPADVPDPVRAEATSGELVARVLVEPGVAGPNRVELRYVDAAGRPVSVDATDLRISRAGVEPRRVEVRAVDPSTAVATDVVLTPGPWRFEVTVVARGTPSRFELEVMVR